MQVEKDKSSKIYFDNLLNPNKGHPQGGSAPAGGGGGGGSAAAPHGALSPIEQAFHQHMKKSLLSYEEYHKSLRQKFERGLDSLKSEFSDKMVKAKEEHKGAAQAADTAISALKTQFDARRAAMEESFANTEKFVVEQYEEFLEKTVVSVQFLPVQVFLTVSKREGVKIPFVVKPTDTPKDLKEAVRQHFEKLGDPIKEFGPKNYFVLKRAYGKGKKGASPDAMDVDEPDDDVKIKNEDSTILQYKPEPGSTLCLRGKLQMRSEEPKKCLKETYDPVHGPLIDYSQCKTCNLTWLCPTCVESCHAGHQIVSFLKQHKPAWACCYCHKSKKCKLFAK